MDSDRAGKPDQQAGAILSRVTQDRLRRAAQAGKELSAARAERLAGEQARPLARRQRQSLELCRQPEAMRRRSARLADTVVDSDRAGKPNQQAGVIHSRATQERLGVSHNGSTRVSCLGQGHTDRPYRAGVHGPGRAAVVTRAPPAAGGSQLKLAGGAGWSLRWCKHSSGLGQRGPARPAGGGGPLASNSRPAQTSGPLEGQDPAGARRPTAHTHGGQGGAPSSISKHNPGKAAAVVRAPSVARGSVQ